METLREKALRHKNENMKRELYDLIRNKGNRYNLIITRRFGLYKSDMDLKCKVIGNRESFTDQLLSEIEKVKRMGKKDGNSGVIRTPIPI